MAYTLNPSTFLYGIKQIVTGINGDTLPNGQGIVGTSNSADGGIKVDINVALPDVVNPAELPVITDSTTGTASTTFGAIAGVTYATDAPAIKNALAQIAKQLNALNLQLATQVSSVPVIVVPASGTTIGTFSIAVPRDYDEASDSFSVRLAVQLANADLGITVTGTATVLPIATGTAVTKTLVTGLIPFTKTTFNAGIAESIVAITLAGYGLKRNDVIAVALAFAGTLTGNGYVYSVSTTYDSTIVSYNETDATEDVSSASGVQGNLIGFGNALR